MKYKIGVSSLLLLLALICSSFAMAETSEKMVIALKTDDFEIAETDISDLAIGDSETIVTESGKTIDLLRTAEGVEVYVDGELLEMPHMDGHHGDIVHKSIVIKCEVDDAGDAGAECGKDVMFFGDGDIDIEALHGDGDHKIMVKEILKECISDEEGECDDHHVWVSSDSDVDFGELHEAGEGHKVIRIHKTHDGEVDLETEDEKVIIIKK